MKTKNVFKVLAVAGLLVGATMFAGCGVDKDLHGQTLSQLADAKEAAKLLEEQNIQSLDELESLKDVNADISKKLEDFELEVNEKDELIAAFNAEIAAEEATYLIDEIKLGGSVTKTLNDKELSLFKGTVDFDGDDYDVREYIKLDNLQFAINGKDYNENVYLKLEENSLAYYIQFDQKIELDEISRDSPLKFSFLGEVVEVVEWDAGKVTFFKGVPVYLNEGEVYERNGQEIKVVAVLEDSAVVAVGNTQKKIDVGSTQKINDLEVELKDVLYQAYSGGIHAAEIYLGDDVSLEVEDGDEYDKKGVWEYVINDHFLGVKLAEEHLYIDEDEDYKALVYGDKIFFPKEFASVEFAGLDDLSYKKISFEEYDKSGETFVRIKGEFSKGLKDYSTLYVNSTGFYDKELDLVADDFVEIDGAEKTLELSGNRLKVGTSLVRLDFSKIKVDGIDVSSSDDNVRAIYGTIVNNPEDSLEDKKVTFLVPEEQVFANLKVRR